jgi:maltose alpha-D-glucosyltransferase/alpha-amylase
MENRKTGEAAELEQGRSSVIEQHSFCNLTDWIKDAVIYQIYPQSFNDSNGDGIGDLPGIIDKLDYLADLGVTLLWLNPCFDSPFFDAGYDVRDFYKIAPRYGTNDDMRRLCDAAHKRGLRVCLDLVAGHSSIECEWFKQSSKSESSKYSDYYIWTDHWCRVGKEGTWISGHAPRNGSFRINFFWSQPALNYGYANPDPNCPWERPIDAPGPQAVVAELKNIMKFWLEIGCDGFRVDMAQMLVKNDPDQSAAARLWRETVFSWLRAEYPYAVMIAEWGNPSVAIGDAGFDIDFMLHAGVPGYGELFFKHPAVCGNETNGICYFDEAGNGSLDVFLREYRKGRSKADGKGFISLPSANHDFQRLNYYRSEAEMKVAFAFLLTWACVPSIYYGDEIGMRYLPDLPSKEGGYTRTGTRTPMQWNDEAGAGFSNAPEDSFYLPLDPAMDRPDVASQQAEKSSLLSFIKELLALRNSHAGLRAGADLKILSDETHPYPLVYQRSAGSEKWLVALNPSGRSVEFTMPIDPGTLQGIVVSGVTAEAEGLAFGPVSWGIFRINE